MKSRVHKIHPETERIGKMSRVPEEEVIITKFDIH